MAGRSSLLKSGLSRLRCIGSILSETTACKSAAANSSAVNSLFDSASALRDAGSLYEPCVPSSSFQLSVCRAFTSTAAPAAAKMDGDDSESMQKSPKRRAKKAYRDQQKKRPPQRKPAAKAEPLASGESLAETAEAEAEDRQWEDIQEDQELESLAKEKKMTEVSDEDVLYYIPLPAESLPEAFPELNRGPTVDMLPKSGCTGLQEEYAASGKHLILFRPVINMLLKVLQEQPCSHLLLDGMPGSGKSMALAALAHWARLSGWVVLYVPNAEVFMDGGTFAFNEEKDGYDTPESAKYILHNLLVSHGDALGKLRMPDSDRSLAEVAADALEATEPAAAVTAALNVMDELKLQKEVPVLFAVDRYNALYAPSAYGKTVNEHSRRMLTVDELRLGRAMRILEHPSPANGMSIAALARGDRLSRRMPIPLPDWCAPMEIVRFTPDEWISVLDYYTSVGLMTEAVDEIMSFMMTQGNPKELRSFGDGIDLHIIGSTAMYHDRR